MFIRGHRLKIMVILRWEQVTPSLLETVLAGADDDGGLMRHVMRLDQRVSRRCR